MKFKHLITATLVGMTAVLALTACTADQTTTQTTETETGLPPVSDLELVEEDTHEHVYPSDYFTEQGFFKAVNAADFVTMADYSGIVLPDTVSQIDPLALQTELSTLLSSAGVLLDDPSQLTDEEVVSITGGQLSTVAELTAEVEKGMLATQKAEYLKTTLLSLATFSSTPESMIDFINALITDEIAHSAMSYNVTSDALLIQMGYEGLEDYLEQERADIELEVQNMLITQYIAEKEGLSVQPADVDTYFGGADWSTYQESWGDGYINSLVLVNVVHNFILA